MFSIKPISMPGAFVIEPRVHTDVRGTFVKTFHSAYFSKFNLETTIEEEFYSTSKKDVIRGLHFQLPPKDHIKIVYCISGSVIDVLLDLRIGSPTFGRSQALELNDENNHIVYIPKGLAHGFLATSHSATMIYKTSSIYSPEQDSGILWNSIDYSWPTENPILSDRDLLFPTFNEFHSPFIFDSK